MWHYLASEEFLASISDTLKAIDEAAKATGKEAKGQRILQ